MRKHSSITYKRMLGKYEAVVQGSCSIETAELKRA